MISASILAFCLLRIAAADTEASTTLSADGSFKIVQIADLHYDGDSRSDAASDGVDHLISTASA
jgi:predicted MPP superfamily phosphohydrolase